MEDDSVLEISQRQSISMVCMYRYIQHCRDTADNLPALVSEETQTDSLTAQEILRNFICF